MKDTTKRETEVVLRHVVLFCIVAFAIGFGLASLVFVRPWHRSATDVEWHKQFGEDENHQHVMDFQNALDTMKASLTKDAGELSKQLDVQLRIEDLVIKSREAELAKFTPFTPLFAGGFSVGGILGFLGGIFARKRGGSAETPK